MTDEMLHQIPFPQEENEEEYVEICGGIPFPEILFPDTPWEVAQNKSS